MALIRLHPSENLLPPYVRIKALHNRWRCLTNSVIIHAENETRGSWRRVIVINIKAPNKISTLENLKSVRVKNNLKCHERERAGEQWGDDSAMNTWGYTWVNLAWADCYDFAPGSCRHSKLQLLWSTVWLGRKTVVLLGQYTRLQGLWANLNREEEYQGRRWLDCVELCKMKMAILQFQFQKSWNWNCPRARVSFSRGLSPVQLVHIHVPRLC